MAHCKQASVALINPPFFLNDFRAPYLALPHLLGFMHAEGASDITLVDANVSMWRRMCSAEFLDESADAIQAQLRDSARLPDEARRERIYYGLLLDYLREDPDRLVREPATINLFAGVVFDTFYRGMRRNIHAQIESLERGNDWGLLDEVTRRTIDDLSDATQLVGVTVPTADQFYPALLLAKHAKRRFGDTAMVVLGGCIFSLLNRIHVNDTFRCSYVDAVVVHEGEKALLGLYEHIHEKRLRAGIPNLLYRDGDRIAATRLEPPPPLNECPPPLFPLDFLTQYGATPRLPVWASRGCYWGKCTFCDYIHLSSNDNNAELIRANKLVDVVETLHARHGATDYELITECLSPSLSRKFSEQLMARRLAIRWTTHIKVEKKFTHETCRAMKSSGCYRVTIGVESFNNRQLAIMKKGCTREDIIRMLQNLTGNDIWTGINIIVDFPSVRDSEAAETIEALIEFRHLYDNVNVFPFVLSLLTDIARAPDEFGIAIREETAEQHNRGFHFTEFQRTQGVDETEAKRWFARYLQVGFSHQRRRAAERSLEALDEVAAGRLLVARGQRIVGLDAMATERLVAQGAVTRPQLEERFLFDLETRLPVICAAGVAALYAALPTEPVPMATVVAAVAGDLPDKAAFTFAKDVLRYGVKKGLFVLYPDGMPPRSSIAPPQAAPPARTAAELDEAQSKMAASPA
jgi:hypothetical protein